MKKSRHTDDMSSNQPQQEPQCAFPVADTSAVVLSVFNLPLVSVDEPETSTLPHTRCGVLKSKRQYEELREEAVRESRGLASSPEKNALYKKIRACSDEEQDLESFLQECFVPQHSPAQFLSPRAFFVSPLFRVCSKALPRQNQLVLQLLTHSNEAPLSYSGPELRQSDGRVFLSLLNMLRDVQVGTKASFQPELVCRALFGRYDGNSRKLLCSHSQRLQKGLVISSSYSVQLCLGFDYPRRGGWTVALDPHIVELFKLSPEVWFPMQPRLELTDGLATWLYTFIESQTRLIPMRINRLREFCGSDAGERAFTNSLRLALHRVAATGIIDTGWSLRRGLVRWLKKSRNLPT